MYQILALFLMLCSQESQTRIAYGYRIVQIDRIFTQQCWARAILQGNRVSSSASGLKLFIKISNFENGKIKLVQTKRPTPTTADCDGMMSCKQGRGGHSYCQDSDGAAKENNEDILFFEDFRV